MPKRSCSRASHAGAHQHQVPKACMNVGNSTIRTIVESTITANVTGTKLIQQTFPHRIA